MNLELEQILTGDAKKNRVNYPVSEVVSAVGNFREISLAADINDSQTTRLNASVGDEESGFSVAGNLVKIVTKENGEDKEIEMLDIDPNMDLSEFYSAISKLIRLANAATNTALSLAMVDKTVATKCSERVYVGELLYHLLAGDGIPAEVIRDLEEKGLLASSFSVDGIKRANDYIMKIANVKDLLMFRDATRNASAIRFIKYFEALAQDLKKDATVVSTDLVNLSAKPIIPEIKESKVSSLNTPVSGLGAEDNLFSPV